MLENLQKITFKIECTSMKKIHTTLVILFIFNYEKIPLKMLVTPSPFATHNRCCKAKSKTSKKDEREKEQKKLRQTGVI
jgi:hypothetical protein